MVDLGGIGGGTGGMLHRGDRIGGGPHSEGDASPPVSIVNVSLDDTVLEEF